jgi:superoxide dismutase
VRKCYGSEAAFLYELQKEMIAAEGKFFYIYSNGKAVKTRCGDERELLKTCGGVLAVDLSEHAYFMDYGFDKAEYVRKLLPYIDLSILDKKIFDKH